MPVADDPKIMDTLKDIQTREGRAEKPRVMDDAELKEFFDTGRLPQWAIEAINSKRAKQAICDHAGYSFKEHGRCCWQCGVVLVDFGD